MKLFEKAQTMNHHDTIRYRLELAMLERDGALGNRRAVALLRSELALALNAAYFVALSAEDIHVGAIRRSISQDGVARYAVEFLLGERRPSMTDEQAAELVTRAFALAQNASHFLRLAAGDVGVRLVGREALGRPVALRAA
jgi:hypothetical protein